MNYWKKKFRKHETNVRKYEKHIDNNVERKINKNFVSQTRATKLDDD